MKPLSIQTNALPKFYPPFVQKYVRCLRMAAWNALFTISGLLLIALAGEVYLRLANPFIDTSIPHRFVDGVGLIRKPDSELRYADWNDDNFVVSRTNSLGFLDREPISPELAAAGCHIAFIGDSYVEAKEVSIADKFHAQLEEMAARELPRLGVTTQAYGIGGTGQINQIPFYDEYARHLNPKLVVLVFYINDFANNLPLRVALFGVDPESQPLMSAQRDESGALELRPPDPEYERFLLPAAAAPWHWRAWWSLTRVSYFAKWVDLNKPWMYDSGPQVRAWMDIMAERPRWASLLDGWQPTDWNYIFQRIDEEHLSPILEEALEYTAFGMEQFKRRTDRDGAALAILASTARMGTRGEPQFDRLSAIAQAHDIPVISHYDYIVRRGHDYRDGQWRNDTHWNATGHQWVAEAVLEWLNANQDVCDSAATRHSKR